MAMPAWSTLLPEDLDEGALDNCRHEYVAMCAIWVESVKTREEAHKQFLLQVKVILFCETGATDKQSRLAPDDHHDERIMNNFFAVDSLIASPCHRGEKLWATTTRGRARANANRRCAWTAAFFTAYQRVATEKAGRVVQVR
jgi:hypothetical protein